MFILLACEMWRVRLDLGRYWLFLEIVKRETIPISRNQTASLRTERLRKPSGSNSFGSLFNIALGTYVIYYSLCPLAESQAGNQQAI